MHIDPFLFTEEAITHDVAAFVKVIKRRQSELPDLSGQPAHVIRQKRKDGIGIFGVQETSSRAVLTGIPGPAGDIPARIIHPQGPVRCVYLHIHGGGWVLGEAADQDMRLVELADQLGLVTVSIDYRLAPEDPYPAGPDDCEAAAVWIVDNASKEFHTDVVLIGGESAGAHLSAVTLLRMRDKHNYRRFVAANLTYGAYDLTMTPSARNWGERTLILSTATVVLVSFGSYPISMVGVPGAVETNNSPPTLALMMFGLAQTSLLVAMEPAARRMLDRARVRTMTVLINRMIMTLYLWHLTAMVLLIGASMLAGGIGFGIMPGTGAWWMTRPLWLLVVSVATVPFMMIFRRFDTLAPLRSGATIRPVIALGVMASGSLGMALLAGNGISGSFFGINIVAVLLALGTVGALRRLSHG